MKALYGNTTQIGVLMYGGGINIRAFVEESRSQGYIVVLSAGYATIHRPN